MITVLTGALRGRSRSTSNPLRVSTPFTTAPRQDILRVGVFTANGAGGLTGHAIATTDDGSTTLIIDFTFSGTFTVNADGTGTASVSPVTINSCVTGDGTPLPVTTCSELEGSETYAFVLNGLGDDKTFSL